MTNILVTAVGGNIGQGIIRCLNSYDYSVNIIGVDSKCIYPVKHLCKDTYIVPAAKDKHYLDEILNVCDRENVDLIFPGTEVEVEIFASVINSFPIKVACSPQDSVKILLDKYKTFLFFKDNELPFAASFLPSEYKSDLSEIIVKPRKSYSSNGIVLNPLDLKQFSDSHIIQQLHKGTEINTGFYVTNSGKLHGTITFEKISTGINQACNITSRYDSFIVPLIEKLTTLIHINGPADIQSMVINTGEVIPFEVNCRFSGSSFIRSHFGLEDVKYTLEEYIFDNALSPVQIKSGSTVRVFQDAIFLNSSLDEVKIGTSFKTM